MKGYVKRELGGGVVAFTCAMGGGWPLYVQWGDVYSYGLIEGFKMMSAANRQRLSRGLQVVPVVETLESSQYLVKSHSRQREAMQHR